MMSGGNPNLWWSMQVQQQQPPSLNIPQQQQHQHHYYYHLLPAGSTSSTCSSSSTDPPHPHHQSWTQLLLNGEEERLGFISSGHGDDEYSHMVMATTVSSSSSSGSSCCSSSSSFMSSSNMNMNMNMLVDFTYKKPPPQVAADQTSSECNSRISRSVGVCNNNNKNKKGRVQGSQPHLKVRKEKLGDRITALHQLVSPFGKTDTASVLMEAIGYIGFLHAQIQALTTTTTTTTNPQHSLTVQGGVETNCVFPEEPSQLLNNNNEDGGLKRKGGPSKKDLFFKSRGLCLVPISCTQHFGTPNANDYWPSPFATGF